MAVVMSSGEMEDRFRRASIRLLVAALSEAELAAMAEEATVDAYGEDKQANGLPHDDRG